MVQTIELIEDLNKVKNKIKELPSRSKYKKHGQWHPATIERRFGSWNKALQEIFGEVIREQPELRPIVECLKCGEKTKNAKFCSRRCAISVNNIGVTRNLNDGKFKKKPCKECKTITSNAKYCSRKCSNDYKRKKIEQIIESGKYANKSGSSDVLKNYVIRKRGYQCEQCKSTKWLGQNIPLNLHHKDGDAMRNELSNLELLCLNCHGLTPNFGRKNKKSTRTNRYKKK
jgi:hypothetical protein